MRFVTLLLKITLAALLAISLTACKPTPRDQHTVKVGTIAGPETQLMEVAKGVAKAQYGLTIEIVPFTDYNIPNDALADGSIDANMFQHQPYLDQAIKARGYKITAIAKTFVYPMGVYSKKITRLDQLPNGATVAIPNDPSNEARSLLLLQKAGLIQLDAAANPQAATLMNIIKNPKQLKIRELDAAQLPRTLPDVDLAAINTNYAMIAGLLPSRDALILESPNSPYANLIVVRKGEENDPRIQQLVAALHSDAVVEEANKLFQDQALPAWK